MKICPNCNEKLEKDTLVCTACGCWEGDKRYQSRKNIRKSKKNKSKLVLFLILAIMGVIAVTGYVIFTSFNVWTYTNEADKQEELNKEEESTQAVVESAFDFNFYDAPKTSMSQVVFLLSFEDQALNSTVDDWSQNFYGDGLYGFGSVNDYFLDSSKGMFAFEPINEDDGINDGFISVEIDEKHPVFEWDYDAFEQAGFDLYERVLEYGDTFIDYASFDLDGDGYVDSKELSIVFVFAGYEDNELNIKGQSNVTSSQACSFVADAVFDDVSMFECVMIPEFEQTKYVENLILPIGTICHELGHTLGLPDLYDIDYSSEGLSFHSLMGSGNENYDGQTVGTVPAPLIAWSREYLGFIEPEIVDEDGTYRLSARSLDDYNVIKIVEETHYYLIENVDFVGYGMGLGFELVKPGIAIWQIDDGVVNDPDIYYNNSVNSNEEHMGIKLLEANGTQDLLMSSDLFVKHGDYDHYFRFSSDNQYITSRGTIIEILDNPGDTMSISVTFKNE